MRELIERIRQEASLLEYTEDTIALDKSLGELDYLIHVARQEIDIEWREARSVSRKSLPSITESELDALLADMGGGR